jgi:hypothetical protein
LAELQRLAPAMGDGYLRKVATAGANTMKKIAKTRSTTTKKASAKSESPSRLIDGRIKELGDWRGKTLAHMRALIKQAEPEVVEEWKWRGVPVWYRDGMICTGETYKSVVKLTFAKGAALKDPAKLFNSSLEGNVRRAIDIHEGEDIDENAFKTLVRAAVTLNKSKAR